MIGTNEPPDPANRQPAWCDRTRCTADPANQANGYRTGAGGEHRSAPVPLNLTTAMWLPVRDGTAWLTEACAPWPCDPYQRVQEATRTCRCPPTTPGAGHRFPLGAARVGHYRTGGDPMKTRTDKTLLILTALFVAGLAFVAGAISFAHMRELAHHHDQTGWKAYAFPISVDGLEIVASLYLVAQRRAGRPTGWIPWVALIVGTAASLAANVAVGGADPIGKALAGWPALSMLIAVKLLFAMIDHTNVDQRTAVPDDQRTSAVVPDVRGTVRQTGRDDAAPSGTVPGERTNTAAPSATGPADRPAAPTPGERADAGQRAASGTGDVGDRAATPLDIRTVAHLVPAARAARATLANEGRSLSRDNLADAMRNDGHGVSNERASLLLKILKAEDDATPFPVPAGRTNERTIEMADTAADDAA